MDKFKRDLDILSTKLYNNTPEAAQKQLEDLKNKLVQMHEENPYAQEAGASTNLCGRWRPALNRPGATKDRGDPSSLRGIETCHPGSRVERRVDRLSVQVGHFPSSTANQKNSRRKVEWLRTTLAPGIQVDVVASSRLEEAPGRGAARGSYYVQLT